MGESEDPPGQELIPGDDPDPNGAANPPDQPLPPELKALVELEHARIESADRRTAVMQKAFDVLDAQDKRQFEFHKSNADQMHAARRERFSFARRISYGIFGSAALVVALLLWLVFWGTDNQSAIAREMLNYVFVALGGAGVFAIGRMALRYLLHGDGG